MKQTNNACKSELETSLLFRSYEKLTVATYIEESSAQKCHQPLELITTASRNENNNKEIATTVHLV